MDRDFATLTLDNEEEIVSAYKDPALAKEEEEFCLVGCFLTVSIIHHPVMRSTLANLWHRVKGIQITDLGEKRYMFRFFHKWDMDKVLKGTPWTFNSHLLMLYALGKGEDPLRVTLIYTPFWVQIHGDPTGFFFEALNK